MLLSFSLHQMMVSPLSELNSVRRAWTVQVYVSRVWQHRGTSDDDPVRHLGIVLQDTQVRVRMHSFS